MSAASFLPFAWMPSAARTIALFDYAHTAPGDRIPTPMPLRWPDKAAASVLDYTLDASALLASGADTISAYSVSAAPLAMLASTTLGGRLTLWLGGGVSGTDYPISLTLTTASTRSVQRIVRLLVV